MENMKKGEEVKKEEEVAPKMRQIIVETDGTVVNLIKADVAGRIELVGIFQTLINALNQPK